MGCGLWRDGMVGLVVGGDGSWWGLVDAGWLWWELVGADGEVMGADGVSGS